MRKISKILLIIIMLLVFMPKVNASSANTIAELRKEIEALKAKKQAQGNKKAQTQSEINATTDKLNNTKNEITEGKNQIETARLEIEKLNKEIEDGTENIKSLMNSYQINSADNAYMDYIFEAESYADFVYRYTVIKQVIDYNKELIDGWNEKIIQNEQLQVDLANKEVELNKKVSEYETNIDKLGDKLAAYSDIVMDIQDEIDSTQELLNYYKELGCGENQNIYECISVKGDTMFRKPLVKGTITSYYGYRINPLTGKGTKFHSGTDIGGNKEGTNVYATANGTVGKIIRKASCGGNQVYVWHTIGGKKYTSLYMHLLNINVSIGDKVDSNTVVGTVGGGKGTWAWETCSTGAHLHFSVATGWYGDKNSYLSYSSFLAHLIDSKEVAKLPNKGKWWYSR
ncbi:MAG: peptidoglycan DD-metalloendopeptidase family protein [Tenericutes bacterium]|nr:peptidoglycan DD-metalloendopeptidase family protein [Mycoplasmatota bacterium]